MGNLSVMKALSPAPANALRKLLIPVDATAECHWPIQYAIRCGAAGTPLEVHLLTVIELPRQWEVLRFHSEQEIRQRFEERAAIFLAEAAASLAAAGIAAHRHCREDETVRGILNFAEELGCTEIVVPRLTFLGLFADGLAPKLTARRPRVPVVQVTADGVARP